MDVDFKEAAARHYSDAEHLYSEGRVPNAGQLYGFTAECGLKTLLIAYGLPVDPVSGDLFGPQKRNPYMRHINRLIATVASFPSADRAYYRFLAMMPALSAFSDWSVDQRYWGGNSLAGLQDKWRIAAGEVIRALQEASLYDARNA